MKLQQQTVMLSVVGGIVVLALVAGSFAAGIKFQQRRMVMNFSGRGGAQMRQFGSGRGDRTFTAGQDSGARGMMGSRPVSGEITSMDDKTVTLKLADGSSKVIVFSDTTVVNKTSVGAKSDLKAGETVMVIGTAGSDGTITAEMLNIGGGLLREVKVQDVMQK